MPVLCLDVPRFQIRFMLESRLEWNLLGCSFSAFRSFALEKIGKTVASKEEEGTA